MKILLVSSSDKLGGAGIANWRLYQGLKNQGADVHMLVQYKNTVDPEVIEIKSTQEKLRFTIRHKIEQRKTEKLKPTRKFTLQNTSFSDFKKRIELINPDIIHIQWAHKSFFNITDLSKIDTPILFTMHDMWAFTGGCHYSLDCLGYISNCENCPVISVKSKQSIAAELFKIKKETFSNKQNLHFVALSNWMYNEANKSTVLTKNKIHEIPNLLRVNDYKIINKEQARYILNLPNDKTILLFGSLGGKTDPRKGFNILIKAIDNLDAEIKDQLLGIIIGEECQSSDSLLPIETISIGSLQDKTSLNVAYCAANFCIFPSIQEAFGLMALESLACGTPVCGFNETGLSDIVTHMETGYLAKNRSESDLSKAIQYMIKLDKELNIAERCKKQAENFNEGTITKRYLELYKEILNPSK